MIDSAEVKTLIIDEKQVSGLRGLATGAQSQMVPPSWN